MGTTEIEVNPLKDEMKQFPLARKMDKETEMRKLQQQVIVMRTQQQHRAEKVEELWVEIVIGIIQPIQQKLHEATASIEKVTPKHVSSDLMEQLQKTKEEVWLEGEKVAKILEDFHSKVGTSKEMKE